MKLVIRLIIVMLIVIQVENCDENTRNRSCCGASWFNSSSSRTSINVICSSRILTGMAKVGLWIEKCSILFIYVFLLLLSCSYRHSRLLTTRGLLSLQSSFSTSCTKPFWSAEAPSIWTHNQLMGVKGALHTSSSLDTSL